MRLLENLNPLFSILGILGLFIGIIGSRKKAIKYKEQTFNKISLAFKFLFLSVLFLHPWAFLFSRPTFVFLVLTTSELKISPLFFSSLLQFAFGLTSLILMTIGFRGLFLLKGYLKNTGYFVGRFISIPIAVGIFINFFFWFSLAPRNIDFFQTPSNCFYIIQISTYVMLASIFILSISVFFWKPERDEVSG